MTLLLAAGLLSACASGGGDNVTAPATDTAIAPSAAEEASPADPSGGPVSRVDPRRQGLELGFGEFAITLEADEIRPGPVTFVIRNGGALVHGFEIEGEDDDGDHSGPGNGELKLEGPEFGPGDVVRIHADLAAGVYEIECFVGDHDERGMRATLIVRPGAPLIRDDPAPSPGAGAVQIADFSFSPDEVEVAAGTELTWTNEDPTAHTVTAEDGAFDSRSMDPGAGFAVRLDEPGTYPYTCLIHPTMRATVRVT